MGTGFGQISQMFLLPRYFPNKVDYFKSEFKPPKSDKIAMNEWMHLHVVTALVVAYIGNF